MHREIKSSVKVVRKTLADGTLKLYYYDVGDRKPDRPHESRFLHGSIGSIIQEFRASSGYRDYKTRTRLNYNLFLLEWERYAQYAITEVKRGQVLKMRDAIAAKRGNGAATIFANVTSKLFAFALEREYLEHSPCRRLEPIPLGKVLAWTDSEVAKVLSAFPAYLARAVILAMFTAQRRGDLVKMKWADIGRRIPHTIYVKQEKTGVELDIPIHPTLTVALGEWKTSNLKGDTILLNTHGVAFHPDQLSSIMRTNLRVQNLNGLGVHGLRKFCAAKLATLGCSTHEIMAITGHRTLKMVEEYTRSAEMDRMAVSAMKTFGNWNLETEAVSGSN